MLPRVASTLIFLADPLGVPPSLLPNGVFPHRAAGIKGPSSTVPPISDDPRRNPHNTRTRKALQRTLALGKASCNPFLLISQTTVLPTHSPALLRRPSPSYRPYVTLPRTPRHAARSSPARLSTLQILPRPRCPRRTPPGLTTSSERMTAPPRTPTGLQIPSHGSDASDGVSAYSAVNISIVALWSRSQASAIKHCIRSEGALPGRDRARA
ncbi:hypothetical protein OH77DRAFT_841363 [Trametes cingulata]|nr:hypothetical protein OH77DRAFT_841363 [Trametes cingulata]